MKNVVDHDSFSVGLLELVMSVLYNAERVMVRKLNYVLNVLASASLCK